MAPGTKILLGSLGVALALAGPASALDMSIPGKIAIVKNGSLAKFIAKGAFAVPTPSGLSDPRSNPSQARFFDTGRSAIVSDSLTAGLWSGLGNPAGSKGYKYKNAGASVTDPVKVIVFKGTVIKIIAVDDGNIDGPMCDKLGVDLTTGIDKYCAEFGGTIVKDDPGFVKRKDAPAPGPCPTPGVPLVCPICCGNADFLSFATTGTGGDCGDVRNFNGSLFSDIECGGLHVGGGGNSVPLPHTLPNMGNTVMALTSCTADVATIGPATAAETGSNRTCSDLGCLFGAPFPVPNPGSTPTSACAIISVTTPLSGSVDCTTGNLSFTTSLNKEIFLTGDLETDPGGTIPGIQPCPLCSNGMCIGGPNNGMSCTAGTTALTASYPTSHDCPPDPMWSVANIALLSPTALATTGSITWNATISTNDTGSTASVQDRVFSGFCRDADGTGFFQNPAQPCWQNGVAVGAPCSAPNESCEQRNNGAFGPAGGTVKTITANGMAGGSLLDLGPHAATLVSVFSVPPSLTSVTVDSSGDLPGPGALALPGTLELCADAMSCP